MKWRVLTVVAVSLLSIGAAAQEELPPGAIGYWTGNATTTTEPFETDGPMRITLAAYCFEGIGFVKVEAFDQNGEKAGEVTVLGEGEESAVLDTEPGTYTLEITVSHRLIYTWEVLVEEAEPDASAAGEGADAAGAGAAGSSVVELPHSWAGDDVFTTESFEAAGEWQITLAAYCYTGVSFVTVTVYDKDGQQVGEVTVIAQGVQTGVMDTEPGEYYLEITSPDMNEYTWEVLVEPVSTN